MFNKRKQPPIRSLIAHGSHIAGNVRFTDGLRIDGTLVGDIQATEDQPSILVISEKARVTADLNRKLSDSSAFRINAIAQDGGQMGRKVIEKKTIGRITLYATAHAITCQGKEKFSGSARWRWHTFGSGF